MGCCASEQGGVETERRQGGITSNKEAKSAETMGKKTTGNKPKLIYFSAYGKAEPIRMLLNHAGVQFEDIHINREKFNEMKQNGELPGGQVPIWIDEEGKTFNQTAALMIYLGKKYGYYPEDPWDGYEDDWALANHSDIWKPDFNFKFFKDELPEETIVEVATMFEKWNKVVDLKLEELGSRKFIGGKKPSIGDFITFSVYADFIFNEHTKVAELRKALQAKVNETERVKLWVQRMNEELKEHLAKRHASTI